MINQLCTLLTGEREGELGSHSLTQGLDRVNRCPASFHHLVLLLSDALSGVCAIDSAICFTCLRTATQSAVPCRVERNQPPQAVSSPTLSLFLHFVMASRPNLLFSTHCFLYFLREGGEGGIYTQCNCSFWDMINNLKGETIACRHEGGFFRSPCHKLL